MLKCQRCKTRFHSRPYWYNRFCSVKCAAEDTKLRKNTQREWWKLLQEAAKTEDIVAFYKVYGDYLESQNPISNQRKLLLKMARKVAKSGKSLCQK